MSLIDEFNRRAIESRIGEQQNSLQNQNGKAVEAVELVSLIDEQQNQELDSQNLTWWEDDMAGIEC